MSNSEPQIIKKSKLSLPPQVVYAVKELLKGLPSYGSRYEKFQMMVSKDSHLASALALMAAFIATSFKGIAVEYGEKLDSSEAQLIKKANSLTKDLQPMIYEMAFSLIRDGDLIMLKDGMMILPLSNVTILDKPQKENWSVDTSHVITEANYYLLNEGQTTEKTYLKEEVYHASLNRTSYIDDNMGRVTYGIWSSSPLDSLVHVIMWKLAILQNDMLWRDRLIPRLHHRLKSDMFKPELFSGANIEEKVQAAKSAAQTTIENYASTIKHKEMESDQAFVTLDNIDISVIEPKSSTYSEPNMLVDQPNHDIDAATGVPVSKFSASTQKGSLGSDFFTTSMFIARARHIVSSLRPILWDYIQRRIPQRLPKEKLKLVFDLTLEKDKGDIARQIAVLKATGILTINELRSIWGAPMLSDEEVQKLIDQQQKQQPKKFDRSPDQISETEKRQTAPQYDITPQSKKDKQITLQGGHVK